MLRWLWALVPVLGLSEWVLHHSQVCRAPKLPEWRDLAPVIRERLRPGEVVLVSPEWQEPNARWALGDALMPLRDVARPELGRYPGVLEISLFGKRAPGLAGYELQDQQALGAFELRHWLNPNPVIVSYDFVDHARPEALTVWQGETERAVRCRWVTGKKVTNGALFGHPTFPRERFQCAEGEWSFVGITVIDDEAYRPRRCVWAHPTRGGLRLSYAQASLGSELVGYGGLPYFTSRDGSGTPVKLEAFVDGVRVGDYAHQDGQGWTRFAFDTGAWAGGTHRVEFVISSQRLARREFCFHADARTPAPRGAP